MNSYFEVSMEKSLYFSLIEYFICRHVLNLLFLEYSYGMFLLIYHKDHYELCAFIEYVGHIPRNLEKKELVAHYISYKSLMGEWVCNDNNLGHITHIDGDYKVNMIYRAMITTPQAMFYVDMSGLRQWKKSVVIRGVYKETGRGGGRDWGRGRKTHTKQKMKLQKCSFLMIPPLVNQKQIQVFYNSSSNYLTIQHNVHCILFYIAHFLIISSDKPYSLRQRTPTTRTSTYETRRSS